MDPMTFPHLVRHDDTTPPRFTVECVTANGVDTLADDVHGSDAVRIAAAAVDAVHDGGLSLLPGDTPTSGILMLGPVPLARIDVSVEAPRRSLTARTHLIVTEYEPTIPEPDEPDLPRLVGIVQVGAQRVKIDAGDLLREVARHAARGQDDE